MTAGYADDDYQPEPVVEEPGNEVLPFRAPVPGSFADLVRKSKRKPTINSLVEAELPNVWGNPVFQKLISGIFNEESVEGSLRTDDQEAARMIREVSTSELREKPLEAIRHALQDVLGKYGERRVDRRKRFEADKNKQIEE